MIVVTISIECLEICIKFCLFASDSGVLVLYMNQFR